MTDLRFDNYEPKNDYLKITPLVSEDTVRCGYDVDDRIKSPMNDVLLQVKCHSYKGVKGDILAVSKVRGGREQYIIFHSEFHGDGEYDLLYLNGNERLWKSTNYAEEGCDDMPRTCLNWIKEHDPNLTKCISMWDFVDYDKINVE